MPAFRVYNVSKLINKIKSPFLQIISLYFELQWRTTVKFAKKRFKTRAILKAHSRNVHANSGNTYNCNICSRSFKEQPSLKLHLKVFHGGQKDFKCESCGKSFSQSGYLKR